MIKDAGRSGLQVVCNKCGRYSKACSVGRLVQTVEDLGWYRLSISPSQDYRNTLDFCDTCAKKYTLAQLG